MAYGYQNRILRVNLSNGDVTVEQPGDAFYRQYLGGRGIIAHYLYKELDNNVDPLGPENKLIFAAGPLTGTTFIGGGRSSVGAKSPLTGAYGDGEAGGFFGAEMKRAGYDAIIVEGQSEKPVYLAIEDENVEIRDAAHLWGKLTGEVQEKIQEEMGDQNVRVTQIGVAGENLVKLACVVNDLTHFHGRSGIGAVMGSKKLRAIGIKGSRLPKLADADKMKELNKIMAERYPTKSAGLHDLGTTGIVMGLNAAGGLPTRNFREGTFEGAQSISGELMRDTVLTDREGCYMCPIKCKRVVEISEPYKVDPTYGGPEYETLGSLGSNCGVDDLAAVCKGNELCNSLGLDTIGTGVAISFAMECYENGLIDESQTDGLQLNFGNGNAMVTLVEKIAKRDGLGDLLADGSRSAAEKIGENALDYAMQVKGQEIPMHEPRFKQGLGIGYQISPTGADHCHNLHDTAYAKEGPGLDAAKSIGLNKALPIDQLDAEKAHMLKVVSAYRHLANLMEFCQFVPWTQKELEEAINAATGWGTSLLELMKASERVITLTRLFNMREGFTDKDDIMPKRFYQPMEGEGPTKGVAVDYDAAQETRLAYYSLMGWSEKGEPTKERLAELDLLWALE